MFIGRINVNMHIAQILSLDRLPNGASLGFVNEAPMDIVTGNERLGMTLYQVIHHMSEAQ